MPEENADLMRAAMAAFNDRDGDRFDGLLAADALIVPVRAAVEGTVYRGSDAGTQYCAAVESSWEDLGWVIEEIREGDGWVIALGRIRGQGRDSGAAIDSRAGWVAHLSGGRIRRFQTYTDRTDALKAVGLED